jgi:hypothetical protein
MGRLAAAARNFHPAETYVLRGHVAAAKRCTHSPAPSQPCRKKKKKKKKKKKNKKKVLSLHDAIAASSS